MKIFECNYSRYSIEIYISEQVSRKHSYSFTELFFGRTTRFLFVLEEVEVVEVHVHVNESRFLKKESGYFGPN